MSEARCCDGHSPITIDCIGCDGTPHDTPGPISRQPAPGRRSGGSDAHAPANDAPFDAKGRYQPAKLPMGTILGGFAAALMMIAKVSDYGNRKHTQPARERLIGEGTPPEVAAQRVPYHNWRNGHIDTFTDAMMRHQLEVLAGRMIDQESALPHLAHVAWNALAALELFLLRDQKP